MVWLVLFKLSLYALSKKSSCHYLLSARGKTIFARISLGDVLHTLLASLGKHSLTLKPFAYTLDSSFTERGEFGFLCHVLIHLVSSIT